MIWARGKGCISVMLSTQGKCEVGKWTSSDTVISVNCGPFWNPGLLFLMENSGPPNYPHSPHIRATGCLWHHINASFTPRPFHLLGRTPSFSVSQRTRVATNLLRLPGCNNIVGGHKCALGKWTSYDTVISLNR